MAHQLTTELWEHLSPSSFWCVLVFPQLDAVSKCSIGISESLPSLAVEVTERRSSSIVLLYNPWFHPFGAVFLYFFSSFLLSQTPVQTQNVLIFLGPFANLLPSFGWNPSSSFCSILLTSPPSGGWETMIDLAKFVTHQNARCQHTDRLSVAPLWSLKVRFVEWSLNLAPSLPDTDVLG